MTFTSDEFFPFGVLLKDFRARKQLTQQQLADAVGVHRHAISRWEHGDVLPQSKTLVLEMARRLGLDGQETCQMLEASLTALAPHWLVPWPRNPLFTGRQQVLAILSAQLGVDRVAALSPSFALHGLSGVGKTQVALEYVYRHTLEYSAVFWIEAGSEALILSSLWRVAEVLHLLEPGERDAQRMIPAVQRWLSAHSQWLLIWDGVEDLSVLDRFLPSVRQGALLITTRCQALGTFARGLDLCPMGREEALLLLLRRAKMLEAEATCEQLRQLAACKPEVYAAAAELVAALGGLPLALDQAGAYLEETHCGLPAYLDLFGSRRAVLLLQRGERAAQHPASVAATLRCSVEATARRHPAIRDLLAVCALLQPEAIPEELFRQGAGHLGVSLETVGSDPLEWDRVIAIACEYSLLARQAEARTLSVHRLVQAVLQDTMTEAEREQWTRRLLAALNALFPEVTCDSWERCERLLPHALGCTAGHYAPATAPADLAELLRKAADYLRERAQYRRAERLYRRALQLRERAAETAPGGLAAVLGGLAMLCAERGKPRQAQVYYQRALQLQEQAPQADRLACARLFCGLACLLGRQGCFEQAETFYRQALQIQEHLPGFDHPLAAAALDGLADLSLSQGRYEQAETLYRQALQMRERMLPPAHPDLAASLYGLAALSQEQGGYRQAETLFLRALQLWEQVPGLTHPRVAAPLYRLAQIYTEQGRFEQAEALHRQALQIREQALGPRHPDVAFSLGGLAGLSLHRGHLEQAEALGKLALQIWERLPGSHPEAGSLLGTLGSVYARQGKYERAEALYRRAWQLWERATGPQQPAPAAARILNGLAALALVQEECGRAESLYRQALQLCECRQDLYRPERAETLYDLALLSHWQGALEEARVYAERALQVRLQVLGEAHPQTMAARVLLARLLPEAVETQTERAFVCATDPVQGFVQACCELSPLAWCRIGELWRAYEQWAVCVQRHVPLSRRAFAAQLKARGCRVDRTNTARIWRGIRLVAKTP
ncbi:MAG TPA: tetratricopeptide repeat protein [Ktedonobacteraceae bacterium]|jgi:tetratricopeptide (TPR) repeat protein/transcriptional regulator with XRE-family HTH domain